MSALWKLADMSASLKAATCRRSPKAAHGSWAQDHRGAFGTTVLTGKLKMVVFEEAVHEDDQFAHAGGEGDFKFLAGGNQPLEKGL